MRKGCRNDYLEAFIGQKKLFLKKSQGVATAPFGGRGLMTIRENGKNVNPIERKRLKIKCIIE